MINEKICNGRVQKYVYVYYILDGTLVQVRNISEYVFVLYFMSLEERYGEIKSK